jgi:hypothetical protein
MLGFIEQGRRCVKGEAKVICKAAVAALSARAMG